MATKLYKRSLVYTGCLTNATATEKENIIALSMYHTLGKYGPSDKHVQTYRNENIIKLYKKYTEENLYQEFVNITHYKH